MIITAPDKKMYHQACTLAKDCDVYAPSDTDTMLVFYDTAVRALLVWQSVLDEVSILSIAVMLQYRRKRIATKLLLHALSLWKDTIYRIFLEVRSENKAAIALYHQLGFVPISVRKNYYIHSDSLEDAIIMCKENR